MRTTDLDFTGGKFFIGFAFQPIGDLAAYQNHTFAGNASRFVDQLAARFGRADHDLREAVSVAEVDEYRATMVAFALDPTTKGDFGSNVRFAELAAGMGA